MTDSDSNIALRVAANGEDSGNVPAGTEVLHGVEKVGPGTVVVDLWSMYGRNPVSAELQLSHDDARDLGIKLIEAAAKERERELQSLGSDREVADGP